MMRQGADVNAAMRDGETALMKACGNGHDAAARELIQQGADVNAAKQDGWTKGSYSE